MDITKMRGFKFFTKGLIKENPVVVPALALCPALAVTTLAENALALGIATLIVLLFTDLFMLLMKNVITAKAAPIACLVIIAPLVTMTGLMMQVVAPDIYKALGIFIPLMTISCLILGRTMAAPGKISALQTIVGGVGKGIGFALVLTLIGCIREALGAGSVFGMRIVADDSRTVLFFILAPGAFITLGYVVALVRKMQKN